MTGTPNPETISTRLERIATLAREMPGVALRTLAQHIDIACLREAYRRTRKDGAVGVDRQTAEQYAEDLERNLQSLLDRAKSGMYSAHPVRRVHIHKGDGAEVRPIGIPTFEDKILQRTVTMMLEAVYEQDFLDCSYGFRPGRSAHQALEVLREGVMTMGGGWVLEVDIRSFLRHAGPRTAADDPSQTGARWSAAAPDRQVAARGRDGGRGRHIPRFRHAAGRGDLAAAGERLPPRGAGHVVRKRGEAPAQRPGLPGSLRGRRDGGVLVGGGCASGVGHTAEAVCSLRVDSASREDSPDRIPASLGNRPGCGREAHELRPAWFHALLDSLTAGLLGHQAQDGAGPARPSPPGYCPVVSAASTRAGLLSARGALPETPRPSPPLGDHRELGGDHTVPPRSAQSVAEVVGSPRRTVAHVVGSLSSARGTLFAPRSHRRPLQLPSGSKSLI